MTIDLITAALQTHDKYWSSIKAQFHERKHFPKFNVMHTEHDKNAMPHRWGNIQVICNKFHDLFNKFVENLRVDRPWRTKYALKLVQYGIQHDTSLE
jgi:hypothetical protein